MRPAFSVIFFTTLIGAGQGLFVALYMVEIGARLGRLPTQDPRFFALGSVAALILLGTGLASSYFHLGHPERSWRTIVMWRTSWLSREVIVLPAFMTTTLAWGAAHYFAADGTLALGALGFVLCVLLFLCTAMIYACIKFLQEWATPLTVVNYTLLGCASGFTAAAAYAAVSGIGVTGVLAKCAVALTLAGFAGRVAALVRNARLGLKSSLQTAIGVRHPHIEQKSQGSMGGSFNTREFFHCQTPATMRCVKWTFLTLSFPVPALMLVTGMNEGPSRLLAAAFVVQFAGLLAERWFFFAQARHPQNLYYQAIS
jgi:DMSO reductase anchor subunit